MPSLSALPHLIRGSHLLPLTYISTSTATVTRGDAFSSVPPQHIAVVGAPTPQQYHLLMGELAGLLGLRLHESGRYYVRTDGSSGRYYPQINLSFYAEGRLAENGVDPLQPSTFVLQSSDGRLTFQRRDDRDRPLLHTKLISEMGLMPNDNWTFRRASSPGVTFHLQMDGSIWGSNGITYRLNNDGTVREQAETQPLAFTLAFSQLGILPDYAGGLFPSRVTGSSPRTGVHLGSFRAPGENGSYLIQTDGSIFYTGRNDAGGIVQPCTYVCGTDGRWLPSDPPRRTPLSSTYAFNALGAFPTPGGGFAYTGAPQNNSALLISNQLGNEIETVRRRLDSLRLSLSGCRSSLASGHVLILDRSPVHRPGSSSPTVEVSLRYINPGRPLTEDERGVYTQEIARFEAQIREQQALLRSKIVEQTCWQIFMYHPVVNRLYNNNYEQFRNNFITPQLNSLIENTPLEINDTELRNLRTRIYQSISSRNADMPLDLGNTSFVSRAETPPQILEALRDRISINLGTRVIGNPGVSPVTTVFSFIDRNGYLNMISFRGREFDPGSTQLQFNSAHTMDVAFVARRLSGDRRRIVRVTVNDRVVSNYHHDPRNAPTEPIDIDLSNNEGSQNDQFLSWFFQDFLACDLSRFPALLAPASRFGPMRYGPTTGLLSELIRGRR